MSNTSKTKSKTKSNINFPLNEEETKSIDKMREETGASRTAFCKAIVRNYIRQHSHR